MPTLTKKFNKIIKIKEYKLLCKVCDNILLKRISTKETYAIPFLHVIREHPFILKRYNDLFFQNNLLNNIITRIKNLIIIFIIIISSLFKFDRFYRKKNITNKKIDILFVSHLLNKFQVGEKKDFYFENISNDLHKVGYNSIIALINHSGEEADFLSQKWNTNNIIPRIILSKTLNFIDEIKVFFNVFKESYRLLLNSNKQKSNFIKNLFIKSSIECLSHRSIINLRISFQIKKIISNYNPKFLIITHEGHSYERLIFYEAKKLNKNIICIGYQHAIIFKFQHAICRNLKNGFNPDIIMTSGKNGFNRLKKSKKLSNINIKLLGSNKKIKKIRKSNINNKCLVLPEGILEECFLLFEFSITYALKNPEIVFIWRLHPGIKFSNLKKRINFNKLPKNILISKKELTYDLQKCSWALYRGTTTIIEAIYNNLRPIYLEISDEINIDPLNDLNVWHEKIKTVDKFDIIFKNKNSKQWSQKNWIKALNYCNNFFNPLNINILIKTLKFK